MNNSILITTIFVVLAAAGAVAWFVLLEHEKDRALSDRIDAMTPDPRSSNAPPRVDEGRVVRVVLEVAFPDDPDRAHTVIAVEGAARVPLLTRWRGRAQETPERLAAHEGALARAAEAVRSRLEALGGDAGSVHAEIVGSGRRPESIEVLNLFLELGLTDVVFLEAAEEQSGTEDAER